MVGFQHHFKRVERNEGLLNLTLMVVFTYIYHKNQTHVGKNAIHGCHGLCVNDVFAQVICFFFAIPEHALNGTHGCYIK